MYICTSVHMYICTYVDIHIIRTNTLVGKSRFFKHNWVTLTRYTCFNQVGREDYIFKHNCATF